VKCSDAELDRLVAAFGAESVSATIQASARFNWHRPLIVTLLQDPGIGASSCAHSSASDGGALVGSGRMTIRAVTFDFWGTLVVDGPGADERYRAPRLRAWRRVLADAGIDVSAAHSTPRMTVR